MARKQDPRFQILLRILYKLDSGSPVNNSSIMEEFGVSKRTAYRYMQQLIQSGFPIYFDKQRRSYRFVDGYRLSKDNLSVEESLVLALSKMCLSTVDPFLSESLEKLEKRAFRNQTTPPAHIIIKSENLNKNQKDLLRVLHHACSNYRRVVIKYRALYNNEITKRKVDPYYLFYAETEGFWYLRGYCHLREDFRTFALDRIVDLKELDEYFLPVEIDPGEEISRAFGSYIDGEPVEVVLRFDAECKAPVLRRKWHQSQKVKELDDGRVEVSFIVNGFEGIKNWIYRWIPYIEVLKPIELLEEIRDDLERELKRIEGNLRRER